MFWFRYDAIDYFFFTDELKFFLGGEIEKDNGVCVCWGHGMGAWGWGAWGWGAWGWGAWGFG